MTYKTGMSLRQCAEIMKQNGGRLSPRNVKGRCRKCHARVSGDAAVCQGCALDARISLHERWVSDGKKYYQEITRPSRRRIIKVLRWGLADRWATPEMARKMVSNGRALRVNSTTIEMR